MSTVEMTKIKSKDARNGPVKNTFRIRNWVLYLCVHLCCTYVYLCCTYVYTYVVPLCTPMLYLCARPCCNYVYLCVHEADKVNIFQIIFDLRRNWFFSPSNLFLLSTNLWHFLSLSLSITSLILVPVWPDGFINFGNFTTVKMCPIPLINFGKVGSKFC